MVDQAERPALVERVVGRALAPREEALADEVTRIMDATYVVISRTETVDPPLRAILREAGLSTPAFYRHFRSKDELLVGLLEQGWDTLRGYLEHQMAKVSDPEAQIAAWVRGMLAQASDREAARRARPFVMNLTRLATRFPNEYRTSRDRLVALLVPPVTACHGEADAWGVAFTVYELAKAVQDRHLLEETRPSPAEAARLVAFVLASVGDGAVAP